MGSLSGNTPKQRTNSPSPTSYPGRVKKFLDGLGLHEPLPLPMLGVLLASSCADLAYAVIAAVSHVCKDPALSGKYCFPADVSMYHQWLFSLSICFVVIPDPQGRRDDLMSQLDLSNPISYSLYTDHLRVSVLFVTWYIIYQEYLIDTLGIMLRT